MRRTPGVRNDWSSWQVPTGDGQAIRQGIDHSFFVIVAVGLVMGGIPASTFGQQAESMLRVRAQVAPAPYYLGQAITLRVAVVAGSERPSIETPHVAGAEVTLLKTGLNPISSSGIGSLVSERIQFWWLYHLVPQRAGSLTVPSIKAQIPDGIKGSSTPLLLKVERPPDAGRPATFLGGIGSFELETDAQPTRVRVGQEVRFDLRVKGPGALGMAQSPKLNLRTEVDGPAPRIVAEPSKLDQVSASRTFRFRIRPTRAGKLTIPPLRVSSFDPRLRLYFTKASSSLSIEVIDIPEFDTTRVAYQASAGREKAPLQHSRRLWWTLSGAVCLFLVAVVFYRTRSRLRSRRPPDLLADRLERICVETGPASTARAISEALVEFLHLAQTRPRGALTPREAREAFNKEREPDARLGEAAERLLIRCDEARFSGEGPPGQELIEIARSLADEIRNRSGGWVWARKITRR